MGGVLQFSFLLCDAGSQQSQFADFYHVSGTNQVFSLCIHPVTKAAVAVFIPAPK